MKTYLYLLRRNKKGFKLLSVLGSQPIEATKLEDVYSLNLPESVSNGINEMVYAHRMDWELWIETALNFNELKDSIEKRGYSELPNSAIPMHNSYSYTDPYYAETKKFSKKKTMLRKGHK